MVARSFFCLLAALPLCAQTPPLPQLKQAAAEMIDARAKLTQEIVDSLFSFAELGYQEYESAGYVTKVLEKEGFQVTRGAAGMDTAFIATWGSGKPVIGLMADIDGLPETSQKPGVAYHAPLVVNGPGHGEGHNAGQAVNVTAAIVVKQIMQKYKIPGTIRVYPGVAEELIGSRTFMVNAGMFRDVDVMLSSHIAAEFGTSYGGPANLGLVSVQFTFEGRSAHGATPWNGRSALDAVELMNIGWNYRREHLPLDHRSHYNIVHGGDQPNVVPPVASVWYYFRERSYEQIKDLHAIGSKIAQAAAMMTDTKVSERVLGAAWPTHFSKPVAEALHENIKRVGMPNWSEDDLKMARAAQAELKVKASGLHKEVGKLVAFDGTRPNSGTDDIAEVSWNVPTVVLRYPGNIPGMIGHHWSSGIAMATPIAHKGSTAGAKAHAMTVLDLLLSPSLLAEAKAYFAEQTKDKQWKSLIPEGTPPPVHLNRDKMAKYLPELKKLKYDPSRYKTYLEQLGIQYPTVRQ